jgi:hypothetical protein
MARLAMPGWLVATTVMGSVPLLPAGLGDGGCPFAVVGERQPAGQLARSGAIGVGLNGLIR